MGESKRATAAQRRTRQSMVTVRLPGGVEVAGIGEGREEAFRAVLAQCLLPTEDVRYELTLAGWAAAYRAKGAA
jgi:hypothetical protein